MGAMVGVTIKGIFRDRIFQGILVTALLFVIIPAVAALSMRQVAELSVTLALSLISFILLLLAVFLGGTLLWRDIERRYTYAVLGLPLSRAWYLLGRFFGVVLFLLLTATVLGLAATLVVLYTSTLNPPAQPLVWGNFFLTILFDVMKFILLVALGLLFSSFSTSFFLPIFGTIAVFFAGGVTQQVLDYINSPSAKDLSPLVKQVSLALYYVLPNFSAFNLKVHAIYGLPVDLYGLVLTGIYFVVYTAILLVMAIFIFSRRELR